MGREAECAVTYNGRTTTRKALLETDEIVVQGSPRVRVPRGEISRVEVRASVLHLTWKGGEMSLALGAAQAEKWAHEILHPKTRLDKLGVKRDQKVVVLHVDDEDLPIELARAGAAVVKSAKDADVVFVQADAAKELARVAKAAAMIAPAGAVWVVTPRGVEGVKDTDVMKVGKAAGLVDVKVVRFNETHTALKFVVPKAKRR